MAVYIDRLKNKIGAQKCHLVAHSFTGIDARAAISMFGADKNVQSLTTICSPHRGMRLIDLALGRDGDRGARSLDNLERVFEVLGLTGKSVSEFLTPNISAFNEVCQNNDAVNYYSMGAKKGGRAMSTVLKDGHDLLVNDTFGK